MQAMPACASIFIGLVVVKLWSPPWLSLSVRKLDDETLSRLRIRAAKHGVSMEEEARRILKDAVSAPDYLGDLALRNLWPEARCRSAAT